MAQITFTERKRESGDVRCGTTAGNDRHLSAGEPACEACKAAKAEYDKRWRAAPERTRINRMHAKAQSRALRALKDAHPDEYRALYVRMKAELTAEHIRAESESP